MNRKKLASKLMAMFVIGSVLVLGCKEDKKPEMIIGDWEADDPICGDGATMEVEDDLEGTARLFFFIENDCYYADFNIEVDVVSSQEEYEIDFEADAAELGDLDFTMECEVDDDELDCEGDGAFDGFEWTFELD